MAPLLIIPLVVDDALLRHVALFHCWTLPAWHLSLERKTIRYQHRNSASKSGPVPWFCPILYPRVFLCCIRTLCQWSVSVGGLFGLLIVWYLFAAYGVTKLSESSPLPAASFYPTPNISPCQRELPDPYFSLTSDSTLPQPQALNTHRAKRRSPKVSTLQRTRLDVLATGYLRPVQKVFVDQ
jgi:hypothetical protein